MIVNYTKGHHVFQSRRRVASHADPDDARRDKRSIEPKLILTLCFIATGLISITRGLRGVNIHKAARRWLSSPAAVAPQMKDNTAARLARSTRARAGSIGIPGPSRYILLLCARARDEPCSFSSRLGKKKKKKRYQGDAKLRGALSINLPQRGSSSKFRGTRAQTDMKKVRRTCASPEPALTSLFAALSHEHRQNDGQVVVFSC